MAYPTLHKGAYGVNYRTNIGLLRTTLSTDGSYRLGESDPSWDIFVGPLPFLLANNDDKPYLRETTQTRRDRFDQSREPGENSLDSSIWLRSQTSWHLGAGQEYSEPLEEDSDVARFRFYQSGGVDPWVPGILTLLPETAQRDTGARQCLGIPGVGVLVSTNASGVRKYPTSGASTQLSTKTVTKIAANSTRWFGISSTGVEYGDLSGATGEGAAAKAGLTAIHWGRDRLWVGEGSNFYEMTGGSVPAFPGSATHAFKNGTIVDIDSGAGGVYIMLNAGLTYIYVVTVKDDGTLNPPREVASLPRGETGNFLYGYLGRYLVIGTNKGVRVADAGTPTELPVGPLVVEMTDGALDATGSGNFIWVTAGTEGVKPTYDATGSPGLYRLDLSRQVSSVSAYGDTAAARYAYATDMYASTSGKAYSVTTFADQVFFVAGGSSTDSPLWQQQATPVDQGWIKTGQISFSTAERKTWLSMGMEISGAGYFQILGSTGNDFYAVNQTEVAVPFIGDLNIDSMSHPTSGWFSHVVRLIGNGTVAGSPTLKSMSLRATPAPKRTRYIQLPLLCLDNQIDRNNVPVGYKGFAYDRLKDLESLEETGSLIVVIDQRTGESVRCQIDKVNFSGNTPPNRQYDNFGGIITLTLLTV